MIYDLGIVKPGSTIRLPFNSFDKDDGSAITMTNYAAADILVYKDGGTTERASTSGYTATTDFDGKTGKHLAIIDLADDTTADFWKAGSEYLVALDAVTVDAVTVGGWIARFRIGYPGSILDTSIATLSSQTSFTLTAGPAEDNALNGCVVLIHDKASAVQCGFGVVSAYTGATKTVTLTAGVSFTAAAIDNISFFHPVNVEYFHALAVTKVPLAPTTAGRDLDVSAGGEAGVDWANVGTPGSAVSLSSTTVATVTTTTTATNVTTVNGLAANVITAASINADAITAAKIADGAIDAATFAASAITATVLAADCITAAKIADGAIDAATFAAGAINAAAIAADAITDAKVAADVTIASVTGAVGSVTGAVGSVTGAVGSVTGNVGGNVTGSIGSLAAQAKADVNAEVVDAVNVDTYAEPAQGAPGATISLAAKIGFLYKFLRNKTTQTSTTFSVYADDAATVDQKAAVSDDGVTFSKGEVASGP